MCIPSNTCLRGHTRVHIPNGILIASAVFAQLTQPDCGIWTLSSPVFVVVDRYRSVISPCVGHRPVSGAVHRNRTLFGRCIHASNLGVSSTVLAARFADVARLDLDAAPGSSTSCPISCPLRPTVVLSVVLLSNIRGSSAILAAGVTEAARLDLAMLLLEARPLVRPLVHFDRLPRRNVDGCTRTTSDIPLARLVSTIQLYGFDLRVVVGSGGHSDLRPSPSSHQLDTFIQLILCSGRDNATRQFNRQVMNY